MDNKQQEFARLVVEVGLNVQKGQTVVIRTPVQSVEFARLCASAAYDAGCREVVMDFNDAGITRMKYLRADGAVFDECPAWQADKMNEMARKGAAFLTIHAEDPDMLAGVDPDRIHRGSQASGLAMHDYWEATTNNKVRWTIVSVPIEAWAKKVFPIGTPEIAIDALWQAIYKAMRITGDGEAVARWQEHLKRLEARGAQLNALDIQTLHYQNSLGTDFTIGLPKGALWVGGAEKTPDSLSFVANMPTEELFTSPDRRTAKGKVVTSMPLVLNGNVVEEFTLIFEDGKVVSVDAPTETERTLVQNAIEVDEGASYIGEVALVPYDSPISNLGILFYNTLFDENAACHMALGQSYPCVAGGEDMSADELKALGLNNSFNHMDFMIGTKDLSITATTRDGREVVIFQNGNYAL